MAGEWLGEDFRCDWCDLHWPHHHDETTAPNGNVVQVVVYHVEHPNAEVRDPETGEVIFPARKAPFKLIEGGVKPALGGAPHDPRPYRTLVRREGGATAFRRTSSAGLVDRATG